tara:strand:+ start:73 stop:528 length:456 start_codon:yes stop_codon:yes gene_type:complete
MFEDFKKIGDAFKSFGKNNIDTDKEEFIDPLNEKIAQRLKERDSELIDLSTEEVMEREKEVFDIQREKKEDNLEKKLKNIEKVIDTFGGGQEQIPVKNESLEGSKTDNINLKAIDTGNMMAKEIINDYLKPSVNADRVGLLYENLRKYNLI